MDDVPGKDKKQIMIILWHRIRCIRTGRCLFHNRNRKVSRRYGGNLWPPLSSKLRPSRSTMHPHRLPLRAKFRLKLGTESCAKQFSDSLPVGKTIGRSCRGVLEYIGSDFMTFTRRRSIIKTARNECFA